MDKFRTFLRGPWGKVVLAAIILPFVISGFYGYFTGGAAEQTVAEVEGTSIHRDVVNQRVQQIRQQIRQQSPDVDQEMLERFITAEQVLEGMINNALITAAARDAGMRVSETQAAREIRQVPQFQQDGRFSEQLFERAVRASGQTPRRFLSELRDEMLVEQYQQGFQQTDFALPGELREHRRLSEQRRDIELVRVALDERADRFEVSEEDIEDYYERHAGDFVRPEKFRMAWLEISPELFRERVEISEEDLRAEYETRREMRGAEPDAAVREAAHLMLSLEEHGEEEARELARSLRERMEEGEDFEELVREYSDDAATARRGGSLGRIGRDVLPEALEEALFALEDGEISEPVASDDGIHLLRAGAMERKEEESEFPSFEEMREELRQDLVEAAAEAELSDAVIRLEELAFEHPDLQRPAEVLDVPVEETDWFSLDDPKGPAREQRVRETFTSDEVLERGYNSDLIELGDDRYMVVRKLDRRDPEPMALEEVRDEIRERLRRERAREELEELAEKARKAVDEGRALADIASDWGVETQRYDDLGRQDSAPHPALVERVFRMPRPGEDDEVEVFRLPNGDLVALAVREVRDGDVEGLEGQALMQAAAEFSRQSGQRSFEQVARHLRETGRVRVHSQRLERDPREDQPPPQQQDEPMPMP